MPLRSTYSPLRNQSGTAQAQARVPLVKWLADGPLIMMGSWDNTPIFRRRRGRNSFVQDENYAKRYLPSTVDKMKELGVTLVVIDYFKGFGLAAEREYMEDARPFMARCRELGIKVGLYIGSTIAYETFLLEKPEAQDWFVIRNASRLFYPTQSFRSRFYFMHPGFRDYIQEVIRVAIEEFHADELHFDSISQLANAEIFFHPLATEDFRDWLRNKYTSEELKERMGFSDPSTVIPPESESGSFEVGAPAFVDDPVFQEWTDYRCDQLADFFREVTDYARSLNPEVAVSANPAAGMSGRNMEWAGVDYARLLRHVDIMWDEEPAVASVNRAGVLQSKIRTYKVGALMGVRTLAYTGGEGHTILEIAEAMAYNPQCLGMLGDPLDALVFPKDQQRYVDFYRARFDLLYRGVRNIADVAILHSCASMAFSNQSPWFNSLWAQQGLIQDRIPFDIIFDVHLADLSKYKVLYLTDQEALGDGQLDQIRRFVENGGGLVATDHTSLYDDARRRRKNFGLVDLFGVDAPDTRPDSEETLNIAPVRREVGKGRVVYFPTIEPAPGAASLLAQGQWLPPRNRNEIVRLLQWAAKAESTVQMFGPDTVTLEVMEQAATGRRIIHLLNYDNVRHPEVATLFLEAEPPPSGLASLTWFSPDEKEPQPLKFTMEETGRASFALPMLRTYGALLMSPAKDW